jgi:hypothetical protein
MIVEVEHRLNMPATDRSVARAAIITSNYWPEKTGIGQVTTEFAEFLAAGGVDVRVATAMPYYLQEFADMAGQED